MSVMQKILRNARSTKARVVLPELDNPRIKAAADRLITDEIAEPIALMEPDADMVDALVQIRGLKENIAKRMLAKPLIRASAMVATGRADTMVAGVDNPTKRVIEAASLAIGLQDGIRAPSSFFLMLFPDGREMIFADCAVNVTPNAQELSGIAKVSSVQVSSCYQP